MSAQSSIEWTDRTWNPVRGCSIVSPGCVNCYAMKQAHRFSGAGRAYEGLTKLTERSGPQWTGVVRTVEDALREPLSWKRPARVFVNSMSDMFHEDVPFDFIDRVFAAMAVASHHTFQLLTKRADRMLAYVAGVARREYVADQVGHYFGRGDIGRAIIGQDGAGGRCAPRWPLPNVWLGVSVEDQQRANERIPLLLQTPAAVRFISAEPLLGPVLFDDGSNSWLTCTSTITAEQYEALPAKQQADHACCERFAMFGEHFRGIDWVIPGGESGNGARPFDLAWARSIVAQCKAAGVPVFVKQLGSNPNYQRSLLTLAAGAGVECEHGYDVCPTCDAGTVPLADRKGGDPDEWPEDLRVRQFPEAVA